MLYQVEGSLGVIEETWVLGMGGSMWKMWQWTREDKTTYDTRRDKSFLTRMICFAQILFVILRCAGFVLLE